MKFIEYAVNVVMSILHLKPQKNVHPVSMPKHFINLKTKIIKILKIKFIYYDYRGSNIQMFDLR